MPQPNAARPDDDSPSLPPVEPAGLPASPDRELLEQVVRRTLARQNGDDLPPALARALHEAAVRLRAEARPWESIVVELVDQVLVAWFPRQKLPDDARRTMAAEIADVLATDPAAGPRLRRFWDALGEESS